MAGQRRQVVWSEAAAGDLVEAVRFAARKSPDEARRLIALFRSRTGALERSPRRAPVVPELASAGVRQWRELVVGSYRILYRIEDKGVRVGALLDGRRDLEDLLLERLI